MMESMAYHDESMTVKLPEPINDGTMTVQQAQMQQMLLAAIPRGEIKLREEKDPAAARAQQVKRDRRRANKKKALKARMKAAGKRR